MTNVIIMRGIPGSGKNYWIEQYKKAHPEKTVIVCSADDYQVDDVGNYQWDASRVAYSHHTCLEKFMIAAPLACYEKDFVVFVNNTNISAWEYAPYYAIADAKGLEPVVLTLIVPIEVCSRRQTHGVPPLKLAEMKSRLDNEQVVGRYRQETNSTFTYGEWRDLGWITPNGNLHLTGI